MDTYAQAVLEANRLKAEDEGYEAGIAALQAGRDASRAMATARRPVLLALMSAHVAELSAQLQAAMADAVRQAADAIDPADPMLPIAVSDLRGRLARMGARQALDRDVVRPAVLATVRDFGVHGVAARNIVARLPDASSWLDTELLTRDLYELLKLADEMVLDLGQLLSDAQHQHDDTQMLGDLAPSAEAPGFAAHDFAALRSAVAGGDAFDHSHTALRDTAAEKAREVANAARFTQLHS
ncbi:MAG: hypothetical protein H0W40_03755 [Methylibium sp.]|uniref:hypothetical protein n=1 Tax=Methylibium sp. TaxID=2067992 RepID=UPI0017CC1345|nr:hypothetical protein [Methylibium sp.]MBA3596476.1 hypothetical protein [Methylibium sp.]